MISSKSPENPSKKHETIAPTSRASRNEVPWILAAFPALRAAEDVAVGWTRRHGITVLRVGLGIVFFWFGALKLFPGLSPAQDLISSTLPFVDTRWLIKLLAAWEMAIGVGLMTGLFPRATLFLFFLHLPGTALPLVVVPSATWTRFPFALTLEGQYIVKNLVLAGAALVIASAIRRGRGTAARSHAGAPVSEPVPSSRLLPSQR